LTLTLTEHTATTLHDTLQALIENYPCLAEGAYFHHGEINLEVATTNFNNLRDIMEKQYNVLKQKQRRRIFNAGKVALQPKVDAAANQLKLLKEGEDKYAAACALDRKFAEQARADQQKVERCYVYKPGCNGSSTVALEARRAGALAVKANCKKAMAR
jgi:hypothetical protein